MVTRSAVYHLLNLIQNLSYLYERCRSASTISPFQPFQVKGERLLLETLEQQLPLLEKLSMRYTSLTGLHKSANEWAIYLRKKYPDKQEFFKQSIYISIDDAKNLSKDVDKWIIAIIDAYATQGTVFIREEALEEILPESLLSNLDEFTKKDLRDAISCILHLIPTPAAMICFRAAESIVRLYYEKITGDSPPRSWGALVRGLEQRLRSNNSLIGYLDYLREKRNEAEHPDKRFTQEESERVLIHVKGLLEEIKKLNPVTS